ncbi:MAG: class I adenylate-forming enzyme family protein [Tepidisphaeraceae bacterium]
MNIVQTIRAETSAARDKTAIIEDGRALTYAQLLDSVARLGASLAARGIGPGQRIAFRCADGIDYVTGALALLECGAAVVPVADSLTDAELRETIDRIEVHGVLTHASLPTATGEETTERIDGPFRWRALGGRYELDQRCRQMGAAFIRFSSGTTGASKGVVLSHRAIIERTDAANRGLEITRRDVILWVLGMSHHFVVSILLFLRKAATVVVANRDFPFSIFDAATRFEPTFIYASPVHYHLLNLADSVPKTALRRVRLAISTAMKMPPEISRAFTGKFGFTPAEAYGIIEIGLPFINREIASGGEGTVGRILPDYQLQIRNPDGDGIGEVLVGGKGMFDAYYSPWRTREQCLEGGKFPTGDLGKLDPQGRLILLGRCKTVIVCAGMNVFPEEVEEVINSVPGVTECLVFGQDHPQFGQVPVADVVPAPGADAADIIEAVRRYSCRRLSAFKVPAEFRIVRNLPKTSSGKLARLRRIDEPSGSLVK